MIYQKVVRTALTLYQARQDASTSTKISLEFLYDTIVVDIVCKRPISSEIHPLLP